MNSHRKTNLIRTVVAIWLCLFGITSAKASDPDLGARVVSQAVKYRTLRWGSSCPLLSRGFLPDDYSYRTDGTRSINYFSHWLDGRLETVPQDGLMNCWQALLYAGAQAKVTTRQKLFSLHQQAGNIAMSFWKVNQPDSPLKNMIGEEAIEHRAELLAERSLFVQLGLSDTQATKPEDALIGDLIISRTNSAPFAHVMMSQQSHQDPYQHIVLSHWTWPKPGIHASSLGEIRDALTKGMKFRNYTGPIQTLHIPNVWSRLNAQD